MVIPLFLGVHQRRGGMVSPERVKNMDTPFRRQRYLLRAGILSVWLLSSLGCNTDLSSSEQPGETLEFGGTFEQLKPQQKQLVKEWYRQFNQIMGEELDPEVAYGELPYSIRTTFEAVTQAAMNTELTDDSGQSLGTALDQVRLVETVRGQVSKESGDVQFRMYVMLVPGAVNVFERSVQFKRGRDNTYYHLDYPVNYRLEDTPSLQFSITEDGQRADVDVDYKSSKFPQVLFDGHLLASNSDVRPGNNHQTHLQRWPGLGNWWGNLFGLPIVQESGPDGPPEEKHRYPPNPRVSARQRLDVAVEDFLSSWLIQQEPLEAMPYFAATSYPCILDFEPDIWTTEMASFRILRNMRETNQVLGKMGSLEDAVEAINPGNARLKPIKQPHSALFTLSRIPTELVKDMQCRYTSESVVLKHKESFKNHFVVAMKLKRGKAVNVIWTKQAGYWKIVAFHVQPFADTTAVPDSRSQLSQERRHQPIVVDPSLVSRVEKFMDGWFIQKDKATTMSFFSKKSYDCVGLFDDASQPPVADVQERLQQDIKKISDFVGKSSSLEDVLRPADTWDPDLHLIAHEQQNAYTLTSYSDYHAEQLDCARRRKGLSYHGQKPRDHGRSFAVSFQLKKGGEHSPVLTLLWAKEKKDWEIVSYDVARH